MSSPDDICAHCEIELTDGYCQLPSRPHEKFCKRCIRKYPDGPPRSRSRSMLRNQTPHSSASSDQISLPLPRTAQSNSHCTYGCGGSSDLRRLSERECLEAFVDSGVFHNTSHVRACPAHFDNQQELLVPTDIQPASESTNMTTDEMLRTIQGLRQMVLEARSNSQRSPQFLEMNDATLVYETG